MLTRYLKRRKYLYLLCCIFFSFLSFSCKTSSKQLKDNNLSSSSPTEASSIVRLTSHYSKDSLLLLFLTYLPKAHFEIASVHNQVILTEPRRRSNVYYKYRIGVSDGQAVVYGKYQAIPSTSNKPSSSESFWIEIDFDGGGIINARGIEDAKIISDAINDAVLSYYK